MDGASKFVRGDAIAAILITLINILGGFAIGIAQKGKSIGDSLQLYTLLSIGDGLVSQLPALITSTAAGILVTRAAVKNNLGQELGRQLLLYPRAMTVLAVMLGVMAIIPGLPMLPFLVLAAAAGAVAYSLHKHGPASVTGGAVAGSGHAPGHSSDAKSAGQPAASSATGLTAEKLESLLTLDSLQIELGYALVSLADTRKGGDLLERVTGVRRAFAPEMGVVIPPIRLRDNLQLGANEYRFLLKGNPLSRGELMPGYWLAMNATNSGVTLKGVPTVEPVFHLAGNLDYRRGTQERRNSRLHRGRCGVRSGDASVRDD